MAATRQAATPRDTVAASHRTCQVDGGSAKPAKTCEPPAAAIISPAQGRARMRRRSLMIQVCHRTGRAGCQSSRAGEPAGRHGDRLGPRGLGGLSRTVAAPAAHPSAARRRFQPITVGFDTPTRSTMSVTGTPSEAGLHGIRRHRSLASPRARRVVSVQVPPRTRTLFTRCPGLMVTSAACSFGS